MSLVIYGACRQVDSISTKSASSIRVGVSMTPSCGPRSPKYDLGNFVSVVFGHPCLDYGTPSMPASGSDFGPSVISMTCRKGWGERSSESSLIFRVKGLTGKSLPAVLSSSIRLLHPSASLNPQSISTSSEVANVQKIFPLNPSFTSSGILPLWSMWAWVSRSASIEVGSKEGFPHAFPRPGPGGSHGHQNFVFPCLYHVI